jgi:hypothetical protein
MKKTEVLVARPWKDPTFLAEMPALIFFEALLLSHGRSVAPLFVVHAYFHPERGIVGTLLFE